MQFTIYGNSNQGPRFGYVTGLSIYDQADKNNLLYANLG